MVRNIETGDIEIIRKVWERDFKDQFEFPDFLNEFIASFTVEHDGQIIAIAGIKPILESIIVVDQNFSPRARRYALYEILSASEFLGRRHGFDQLHAFIQDPIYMRMLERAGFSKTKGLAVVRNL